MDCKKQHGWREKIRTGTESTVRRQQRQVSGTGSEDSVTELWAGAGKAIQRRDVEIQTWVLPTKISLQSVELCVFKEEPK